MLVIFERIGILELIPAFLYSNILKKRCEYLEMTPFVFFLCKKILKDIKRINYLEFQKLFYRSQYKAINLAETYINFEKKRFIQSLLKFFSSDINYDHAIKKDMLNFYLIQKAATIEVINEIAKTQNIYFIQYDGLMMNNKLNKRGIIKKRGMRIYLNRWKEIFFILPRTIYYLIRMLYKSIKYGNILSKKDFILIHYERGGCYIDTRICFDKYFGKENILYYFNAGPKNMEEMDKLKGCYFRIQSSPPLSFTLVFNALKSIAFSSLCVIYFFIFSRFYYYSLPLIRALMYYIEDYCNFRDLNYKVFFSIDAQQHRHPITTQLVWKKHAKAVCYDEGIFQGIIDIRYVYNLYDVLCLVGLHNKYRNSIGSKIKKYEIVGWAIISDYFKTQKYHDRLYDSSANRIATTIKEKSKYKKIILIAQSGENHFDNEIYFAPPPKGHISLFFTQLRNYIMHRPDCFFVIKEKDLKMFYDKRLHDFFNKLDNNSYILCDSNDITYESLLPFADLVIGSGSSPNITALLAGKRQISFLTYHCKGFPEYLYGKYKRLFPVIYPEDDFNKLADNVIDAPQPDLNNPLYQEFVNEYVFGLDNKPLEKLSEVIKKACE